MVTYNQPGVQYNEGRYNAVTVVGSGSSNLGGLTAQVGARVVLGPGVPYPYRKSRNKPKVKGPVIELVDAPPPVKIVVGFGVPVRAGVSASARGLVTFSAEEDDLQVLLML